MDVIEAILNVAVAHQRAEQWQSGFNTIDNELIQRAAQAQQSLVARAAMNNQLADQTVIMGRNGIALIDSAIHPHTQPAGG